MMKSEEEVKVTFLGDITCDRPMLKAARRADGSFNFLDSFSSVASYLRDSDLVVGNLETVFGGKTLGYNPGPVTYNCPDDLAEALKMCGITVLTTANNHCLDCGAVGLRRTIDQLDALGLDHTGTWKTDVPMAERYLVKRFGGCRVAFVSLTDCINSQANGRVHPRDEWVLVNQLRGYKTSVSGSKLKELLKCILPMRKIKERKAAKMREKGVKLVRVRVDNEEIAPQDMPQIQWTIELLKQARQESDFVIACIHCGGQFNPEPGNHSVQLYDLLEPYADAIIGNHPHVVQRMEKKEGKVRAYSLGSVNMSPSADYVTQEYAPEYSVLLNLYLKKDKNGKVGISRTTFSVLRAQEDENGYVTVFPVNEETLFEDKELKKFQETVDRFRGSESTVQLIS